MIFFLCFNSCAQQQIQPDFYQALLCKADDKTGAAELFEKALNSSNTFIRQAAAEELCNLMYEGCELSDKVLERVRREAAGSWGAAFDALGKAPEKEKVMDFLLNSGPAGYGTSFPGEAALYTLRECKKHEAFFSEEENAVIEGHFAAGQLRFREALVFFRTVLDTEEPGIFFTYPPLLNDLGRSFQYADTGDEGMELFLKWEKLHDREPEANELRFRLLFFAARIARQRDYIEKGITLFEQALPLAPDSGQADACIWYILDSSLRGGPDAFISKLGQYKTQWHDDGYFDDVLDRLSRELLLKRDWKNMIRVFSLIMNHNAGAGTGAGNGTSAARYAWIIGRAAEEGYLSSGETQLAAQAINADDVPSAFKHIASNASFYYRSLSADRVSLDLPDESPAPGPGRGSGTRDRLSAAMEFLLGFFDNNASEFAPRYIRSMEGNLSAEDLRALAGALSGAGLYAESMRLVSVYSRREEYTAALRDMELQYPRPFKELVEKYAAETNIAPSLLFGLIRTESAFQSDIISSAGAAGLTQLMPATAAEMADRIRRAGGPDYRVSGGSGLNLRDPGLNIHIGAYYLGYLMERFDNTLLALLAYNGGMNRIRRWRAASSLPADLFLETVEFRETREYGRKVMAAAEVYRELYYTPNPEN